MRHLLAHNGNWTFVDVIPLEFSCHKTHHYECTGRKYVISFKVTRRLEIIYHLFLLVQNTANYVG